MLLPRLVTVYGLRDPGGRIRYVGIARDPELRLRGHLTQARAAAAGRLHPSRKDRWLTRLERRGKRPELIVLQRDADPSQERYWYFRLGGHKRLFNSTVPPRLHI